ncbi:hypothetical protein AB0I60_27000 [Actinosynnema sp. NPDC050436]
MLATTVGVVVPVASGMSFLTLAIGAETALVAFGGMRVARRFWTARPTT